MPDITIDGQTIDAPAGTTVLAAIRQVGAHLPTLCYLEGLPPYGACRLCLVELVEPDGGVIAACAYPVADGLIIKTDGRRAVAVRKMILEFMLTRCPSSGVIRELAAEAGVTDTRFSSTADEGELCILCGLCVRVCRDAVGAAAIGFNDRGSQRNVGTPFDLHSDACIGCGACAAVCPTDAILVEDVDGQRSLHPWNTTVPLYTCPSCGEPYAPEPMSFLKEVVAVGADTWGMCPTCRRKAVLAQLEVIRDPGYYVMED
jgi:NADH dehydrogenase/NADH:ubiquinone oxidoreductase subunit G